MKKFNAMALVASILLLSACSVSYDENPEPQATAPAITVYYQCADVMLKAEGNSDQLNLTIGDQSPVALQRSDDLGEEFSGNGYVLRPGAEMASVTKDGAVLYENCAIQ